MNLIGLIHQVFLQNIPHRAARIRSPSSFGYVFTAPLAPTFFHRKLHLGVHEKIDHADSASL